MAAAALSLAGCGSRSGNSGSDAGSNVLVAYYSQTGATHDVAMIFSSMLGADTLSIEVQEPYDGTYEQTVARGRQEMENGILPALNDLNIDLSKYDTIFLGYPVWYGTCALPVAALVAAEEFEGKVIVPFCTFGSGGTPQSVESIREALPKAVVKDGFGIRNARVGKAQSEIERFLIVNGYLKGEVEALPDYSELLSVTPEDVEVFNAACGDYKYPLGTPLTVGKRATSSSTDYCFKAQSKGMDGKDMEITIYVTVGNDEGAKPEFTEVVR